MQILLGINLSGQVGHVYDFIASHVLVLNNSTTLRFDFIDVFIFNLTKGIEITIWQGVLDIFLLMYSCAYSDTQFVSLMLLKEGHASLNSHVVPDSY